MYEFSNAFWISGAPAPNSRIASVSTTTRAEMSRVRASYWSVSSAGSAMYGTWNSENAVAVMRKAMSTHTPEATGPIPAGTANVSTKNTGRASAPRIIAGLRVPRSARLRSLRAPITGSMITSHTFATVISAPAAAAAMPRLSVMYARSTRPGSVPKPPVPTDPTA